MGVNSRAIANSTTAIGQVANAAGANATAIGSQARALAANSTAVGEQAVASHDNAAAFGKGVTTSRANQQVFGTGTNTYTMTGIASAASATAQGAPTRLVTSNETGDLAARTVTELGLATSDEVGEIRAKATDNMMAIQSNSAAIGNLDNRLTRNEQRTDDALEGVAISVSLANPDLVGTESFAIAMNWGGYEGENALGFTTVGVLSRDFVGSGARLSVAGGVGVGLAEDNVAGRAGGQLSW